MMRVWARRLDRAPLAAILGLALGAALAFFLLAMPALLLARLVVGSGLADVLPGIAPPFGTATRLLLALVPAGLAGGATYGLFRLIDSRGQAYVGADETAAGDAEEGAYSSTLHEKRAPLFAETDLGAPFELTEPLPETWDTQVEPVAAPDSWDVPEPVEAAAELEPVVVQPLPIQPVSTAPVAVEPLGALISRLENGLAERADAARRNPTVTPLRRREIKSDDALREALREMQGMQRRGG